jgi:hypothetical protein
MAAGVQIEQVDIQRMRKPGYGMPVSGVVRGESPSHGVPVKTISDMSVVGNVNVVVVVDEGMAFDRIIKSNGKNDKQKTKKVEMPAGRSQQSGATRLYLLSRLQIDRAHHFPFARPSISDCF